ncbi:superkiller viralicidic activity 2-like 2-like, partial [Trifolium medium]|nr:superkiller viralicidic activity 2-like 2-like [Trifolium medium]
GTDWGWGVVVNVVKKPVGGYIVDTLLHCSPGSNDNSIRPKPCPPRPGEKGEMHVELGNRFPQGLPKLNPVKAI